MACDMEIAVIGAGPAGLAAGLTAARLGRRAALFEHRAIGGQIATAAHIDNYPGFPSGGSGPDLAFAILDQARGHGLEHRGDEVKAVRVEHGHFTLATTGESVRAGAVILAMGSRRRPLGLVRESELSQGRGVSTCATCDAPFHRDRPVTVVGGGDTALDEALCLAQHCSRVTVVHRGDRVRAAHPLRSRAEESERIDFIAHTEIVALLGEETLTGVRLRDQTTGEETDWPTDALFVCIGGIPNSELVRDLVDVNDVGRIVVDPLCLQTRTPGLFAAGGVRVGSTRKVIGCVADGCVTAGEADKFLGQR
ncbi:FAD-dependent oxidoreductase [Candidatus Sumerlaeota bacterium]|nr:FAD-dependent oxidoreductase [Candidatus Sumerlaeota bacterium]